MIIILMKVKRQTHHDNRYNKMLSTRTAYVVNKIQNRTFCFYQKIKKETTNKKEEKTRVIKS